MQRLALVSCDSKGPRSTSSADIGDGAGLETCNSIPSLSVKHTIVVGLVWQVP